MAIVFKIDEFSVQPETVLASTVTVVQGDPLIYDPVLVIPSGATALEASAPECAGSTCAPPFAGAAPNQIVSFVIPARNEERYLGQCLASIAAQKLPTTCRAIEIIVVDNESTDRTAEVAALRGASVVSTPPGSVSRARNAGAALAHGEWLAFVDADCELPADWLANCLETLTPEDVVAVGSPMSVPRSDATWIERTWFDLALQPDTAPQQRMTWLPTFNILVRRSLFREIGGFDESLVTCEDTDLGYRLGRHGKLIRNQRLATIHNGESKTLFEFFRREAWRSRGNLRGTLRRRVGPKEWISVLGPPFLLGCIGGGLIVDFFAQPRGRFSVYGLVLLLLAASLVAGVVWYRLARGGRVGLRRFVAAYFLLCVYSLARTIGIVVPIPRVEQRAA